MTVIASKVDFGQAAIQKEMLNQFNEFVSELTNRTNFVLVGLERTDTWPLEECYVILDLDKQMLDIIYSDVESGLKVSCPAMDVVTPNATLEQTKQALEYAKQEKAQMSWVVAILEKQIAEMSNKKGA